MTGNGSNRAWQLTVTFGPLRGSVCYVRTEGGIHCFVPWLPAGAVPRSSVRGCVPPGPQAIVPRLSEGRDWHPLVTWACRPWIEAGDCVSQESGWRSSASGSLCLSVDGGLGSRRESGWCIRRQVRACACQCVEACDCISEVRSAFVGELCSSVCCPSGLPM